MVTLDTETDVTAWIAQHQRKDLLRLLTCGSVDDGKSTLIGRLLLDTENVYDDHLAALQKDSTKHGTTGQGNIDLALLTDGLKAEREQGITIDVAYRYFSTAERKFIIADCPGHEQYTRNMATGASGCDLAIILMDARPGHGLMPQTRRHSYIVNLLGIRHVVLAVNKMDCVGWSEARYRELESAYRAFAATLGMPEITCVPMSALTGSNVVERGADTPWYGEPSLLEHLESVPVSDAVNHTDFRFPVQYVVRPDLNFRGFAGTVASGAVAVGDVVTILPAGSAATIKRLVTHDGDLPRAAAGTTVVICLDREVDASRGDIMVGHVDPPKPTTALIADVVWMHQDPLIPGQSYLVRTASGFVPGTVRRIIHAVDVNTQTRHPAEQLELNRIARIELETVRPLVLEPYARNRATGALVLVDRLHFGTMAAGMVVETLVSNARDPGAIIRRAAEDLCAGLDGWSHGALDPATRAALDRVTTAVRRHVND